VLWIFSQRFPCDPLFAAIVLARHACFAADFGPDIPILPVDYQQVIDAIAVVGSIAAGWDTDQETIGIEVVLAMKANLKPCYNWRNMFGRKPPALYNWDRNTFAA